MRCEVCVDGDGDEEDGEGEGCTGVDESAGLAASLPSGSMTFRISCARTIFAVARSWLVFFFLRCDVDG
jgi:hypothetical protein